jgi:predicted dienelactone hydrolase
MKFDVIGLAAVVICLNTVACSQAPDRARPVGRATVLFEDDKRSSWSEGEHRPLLTTIWYPAAHGEKETAWTVGVFRAGWTAVDAELADAPEQFPLVVLSHGTGGASAQLSWLAEHLAANGYLVAAVNHHGNTAAEDAYLPQGFMLWWERARDLSVAIDTLLAHARFGPRIDSLRIGAAGFSLGGYTVLTVAGAQTDRNAWERYCERDQTQPGCTLPPESPFSMSEVRALAERDPNVQASLERSNRSFRDERVRAVYAMAPVLGPALDAQSLAAISVPVRLIVGSDDDQARPEVTARPVAERIPGAELDVLLNVGHYAFLAECSMRGRLFVRQLCTDTGPSRSEVHRRIAADALSFFERTLSNSDRATRKGRFAR